MLEMRMVPVERPRARWRWIAAAALVLVGMIWSHGPEKADEAAEARVAVENRNVPPVADIATNSSLEDSPGRRRRQMRQVWVGIWPR
jgi:hypothetical protein